MANRKPTNKYKLMERIGHGVYGEVFKALDRKKDKLVALKKIKYDNEKQKELPSTFLREVGTLRRLNHPNIVRLLDHIYDREFNMYLVFEYMPRDLKAVLAEHPNGLPLRTCQKYLKQLLAGIVHCHARLLIHRDIKPENVLVDESKGLVKIADFGLSREFRIPFRVMTHEVVTLWYRPPEILLNCKVYTMRVDIWSLGCIFGEILTGRVPFTGESDLDQLVNIFGVLGTPDEDTWSFMRNKLKCNLEAGFPTSAPKQDLSSLYPMLDASGLGLLSKMLEICPRDRICSPTALKHEYLRNVAIPK